MPRQVAIGPGSGGGVVHVDVGDEVVVDLGAGCGPPRLFPLGGDPGPVTTPLREMADPDGRLRLVAVSAGRARVAATRDDGSVVDVTVAVRPRRGTSRHG